MKETKNTIDGVEITITRRDGNSTRQANAAIDLLFKGYKVEVRDHWQGGMNKESNRTLFQAVLRRLQAEHRLISFVENNRIEIDRNNFTLELL